MADPTTDEHTIVTALIEKQTVLIWRFLERFLWAWSDSGRVTIYPETTWKSEDLAYFRIAHDSPAIEIWWGQLPTKWWASNMGLPMQKLCGRMAELLRKNPILGCLCSR